jgi:prepilin peptidase CpaA
MGTPAPMWSGVDPVTGNWFPAIVLLGLVAVGAIWDVHRRRIPNRLMLILAAVGLGVSLWLRPLPLALLLSLSGLLAGGVVWLTPYLFRMVGAADLKLAAAVGIWLGPLAVLRVSFHAALIGGGMALLWLVWSRGALGSWVFVSTLPRALRVGGGDVRPPSMSPGTLPFAVALLIGVGLELLGVSLVGGIR